MNYIQEVSSLCAQWYWSLCLFFLGIVSLSMLSGDHSISSLTVCYGKLSSSPSAFPKKYFLHFYVLGVSLDALLLWGMFFSAPLVLLLHGVHVSRRLYECLHVHQFSEEATMNVLQYLLGLSFYVFVGVSIVSDNNSYAISSWSLAVGALLFVMGNRIQHQSFLILANLRSKRGGRNKHYIPRGGFFNYISCPQYLAECIVYLSLNVLTMFKNQNLVLCFVFVLWNQGISALLTHSWYNKKFLTYPKDRFAFIPGIL